MRVCMVCIIIRVYRTNPHKFIRGFGNICDIFEHHAHENISTRRREKKRGKREREEEREPTTDDININYICRIPYNDNKLFVEQFFIFEHCFGRFFFFFFQR